MRLEPLEDRRLLSLSVTEIMYNPYPPMNAAEEVFEDADEFEFIEVTNTGNSSVWLGGYEFTAGIEFAFTGGRLNVLSPGESVLIVQNEDAFVARYGSGLPVTGEFDAGSLKNSGEQLVLVDGLGQTVHDFQYEDGGSWPGRADGNGSSLTVIDTEGDYRDGNNWYSSDYFGGTPGTHGPRPAMNIIVNEVLTHTDPPSSDSIELFNPTDAEIDLSGWYLSDSSGDYLKFQIPDGTVLDKGEYVVFDESDFNASGGIAPKDFALSGSEGDDVWLMEADDAGNLVRFADHVDFPAAYNGESFGRWPNATGDLYPMTGETLGSENSGPRVGPTIISEVHYNPGSMDNNAELEFIEIHNTSDGTVDMSGWRLRGEVDFDFAPGSLLGSGQTVLLVGFDPSDATKLAAFRDHYDDQTLSPIGPWGADGVAQKLDNGGARVTLYSTDDPPTTDPSITPYCIEDQVNYDDVSPWPESADGSGNSLQRLAADVWGDDPASWLGATPTPGAVDFGSTLIEGDLNGDGFVGGSDLDIIRSHWGSSVPAGSLIDGDPTGDGVVDSNDLDVVRANWGQGESPSSAAPMAAAASADAACEEEKPSVDRKSFQQGKATALTRLAWLEQQNASYREGPLALKKPHREALSDLVFALFSR